MAEFLREVANSGIVVVNAAYNNGHGEFVLLVPFWGRCGSGIVHACAGHSTQYAITQPFEWKSAINEPPATVLCQY